MEVKFEDYSSEVIGAINSAVESWLYEAGELIKGAAADNSRVAEGELRGSWDYKVDLGNQETKIGSPLENAVWEEFGTGEFATKGNGRKGYWVFVKGGSGGSSGTGGSGKSYTLAEAKRAMAILREKGLEAYYTKGKHPNPALQTAVDTNISKLKDRLKSILEGVLS
ncbi:HK97 gp10 family phage protein [Treponema sp.]|uniref:HK97 gp10 family phage protein n=1 Tax=Treponema sp. TaxID=166 RepID=UPI00388F1DD8